MQDQGNRKHYHSGGQYYGEGSGQSHEAPPQERPYYTQTEHFNGWAEQSYFPASHTGYQSKDKKPEKPIPGTSYASSGYQQYQYAGYQQDFASYQQYETVPRDWEEANRKVTRQTQDPRWTRDGVHSSGTEGSQGHAHTYGMSHHPDTSRSHTQSSKSPAPQLTASSLRYYEAQRTIEDQDSPPPTGMERWLKSGQREGPWDGVGSVRRRRHGDD